MSPTPTPLGRLGRYELLSRLGSGGMGEVFLARAVGAAGFEHRLVIKRMLPHLAQSPEFARRFIDEGKLVVRLRHAGIAQVLDLGEEGGSLYLAMEHIDGADLRELYRLAWAADVAPPPELTSSILCRMLEALDYAHRATDEAGQPLGIVHRDVSPSNVLVSRAGDVKLCDFGIARAADRLALSASGAIQGKFSYMSPEQAAGDPLNHTSDQFSVGVMAWELFARARPFDGDTDLKTLDRIRHHEPGPFGAACPWAPPELGETIDRLLRKRPEDRFPSCDDARRALGRYLQQVQSFSGTRETAEWVERVLATVPEPLRQRKGVSVDEALRLSLEAPLGDLDPSATPSVPADPTLPHAATTPRGTPPATPSGLAETPRSYHTATLAPSAVLPPPPAKNRLLRFLVASQIATVVVVVVVVLAVFVDLGERPAPTQALPTAPLPVAAPTLAATPRTAPSPPPAAEIGPVPVAVPDPFPPPVMVTRPAIPSGAVLGAALATLTGELPEPKLVPPRAAVRVKGAVAFRFLPASAAVMVDGDRIPTGGSNVVRRELPAGRHKVKVSAGGREVTRVFEVKPDVEKNLGTLTVPEPTLESP
jgi:serine/threonine protein kinase